MRREPTPIAFAEVYLALQNGTVDAQENPLTTIEAKKFYEVQKAIMMTSHIVDGLTTQVAPHVWNKLTDQEKQIFTEVAREAAVRATRRSRSARPSSPTSSRRRACRSSRSTSKSFIDAVLKSATPESMGFTKSDYDKIVAIK
jgi:TRAP-type mannitol/chloroaromatic compound transport system substrate-binding protein